MKCSLSCAVIDMKPAKKQSNSTRERLLESACEVFAKKGYRDATVADICERAGANVAAINYYFGDKKSLYVEAWRLSFNRSLEAYPPDNGIPSDACAEERLRGRILAVMRRLADPKNNEFEIIWREQMNPTGLLSEVMRKSIEPLREELGHIIRELLGESTSERQVLLCERSIMAQCFDVMIRARRRGVFMAAGIKTGQLPEEPGIETVAEHITRFSLAGIREIRRQVETGELTQDSKAMYFEKESATSNRAKMRS